MALRIDSHQHFWRYDPVRHGWITDDMAALKRDFLPEESIGQLHANSIDNCVAVQALHSEQETLFLLELARCNPVIAGVVGWVDLFASDLPQRLTNLSQHQKLRGFRHIVQSEPDDQFMLRPQFQRGIGYLAQFGFTYDILIYPKQLPAAVELVNRFPEQPFVVDHLAKPPVKAREIGPWARQIRELARAANVHCKVSGLVTEADWQHWRNTDFAPYLDVVFDAFGPDRLMFGSDWPVCLLAGSYRQIKQVLDHYMRKLSAEDRDNIFGLNAVRFYGLSPKG